MISIWKSFCRWQAERLDERCMRFIRVRDMDSYLLTAEVSDRWWRRAGRDR